MTKIYYDDSKKEKIEQSLEETLKRVESAINYVNGLSIPNDFSRKNDIQKCKQSLESSKRTIKESQKWLTNTNNSFENKNNEMIDRIKKIDEYIIQKRDIIVK